MLDLTRRPPRRLNDRALLVALTALLCLLASAEHRAAYQPVDAGQMKAVFVVNFLRFVEWPPANVAPAPAPLVVAVLGDRAFIDNLREYADGHSTNRRKLTTKTAFI